jgi:hypothetical protein
LTYFNWLLQKAGFVRNWKEPLLEELNRIPFTYIVAMDENRASDGLELRGDYEYETHESCEEPFEGNNPSVLEVLLGIVFRLEHSSGLDKTAGDWLDFFLENLGLISNEDRTFGGTRTQSIDPDYVARCVNIFMDRRYDPDGGFGGLFVIPGFEGDMRRIELFKQWTEYLRSLPEEPDDVPYFE